MATQKVVVILFLAISMLLLYSTFSAMKGLKVREESGHGSHRVLSFVPSDSLSELGGRGEALGLIRHRSILQPGQLEAQLFLEVLTNQEGFAHTPPTVECQELSLTASQQPIQGRTLPPSPDQ